MTCIVENAIEGSIENVNGAKMEYRITSDYN